MLLAAPAALSQAGVTPPAAALGGNVSLAERGAQGMLSALRVRAGCPGPVPPPAGAARQSEPPQRPRLRLPGCGGRAGGKHSRRRVPRRAPALPQPSGLFLVSGNADGARLCGLDPHAGSGLGPGCRGASRATEPGSRRCPCHLLQRSVHRQFPPQVKGG